MNDTYRTITDSTEGLLKDRGSKFLAYAYPVEDEAAVEQRLEEVKKQHPKARHHCYGWRLGTTGDHFRANDDGEPSGTAGRPILGQIDKWGLTHVLVVVVRYFGGTLLGTGGLIQAYKGAAADALTRAKVTKGYLKRRLRVTANYEHLNEIISYVKGNGWDMLHESYGEMCTFEVRVRLSKVDIFIKHLRQFEGTNVEMDQ